MCILLAYNVMHSPLPLNRLSWDQVQQKGEKEDIETKDEPFEPVSRPASQALQVGWNFGFEMVILHQDERFGVPAPLHPGLGHGCSPGNRSSWKDHGVVDSGNYSSQQSKPDAGGLQCCWWKRVSSTSPRWCVVPRSAVYCSVAECCVVEWSLV